MQNTRVYIPQGGDRLVISSGGSIDVLAGGAITADGVQAAAIADANEAHALDGTYSNSQVQSALNALGVKINAVLAALRAAGLVADD